MSSLGQVLIARLRLIMTSLLGIALRTLVYRNASFHKKICKQVRELPVYSMVAKDLSAWIRVIQNATIL